MTPLGKTTETLAVEFIQIYNDAVLGSRSSDGLRRVATYAKGERLSDLSQAFAEFTDQPQDSIQSIPVLSPGIKDPMPCKSCMHSHDKEWAETTPVIAEHMASLGQMAKGNIHLPDVPASLSNGVVYVGGGKYWPGIVVGVRLLRQFGCNLPIQVWHRSSEPVDASHVDGMNVTFINTTEHAKQHGGARVLGGWESKLWAISHCGFRRILYLDADAYCVADPTSLIESFEAPFTFWHDLPSCENNVKWENVWRNGKGNVPTIQGGQLLIDIPKAWKLICISHWMNQHSDFYYKHMFGDQDTWRVALAAIGDDSLWQCLGAAPWIHPAFVINHNGEPMIVHRCRGKLFDRKHMPEKYANKRGISVKTNHLPREEQVFRELSLVLETAGPQQSETTPQP